jgi:hypothetical protein
MVLGIRAIVAILAVLPGLGFAQVKANESVFLKEGGEETCAGRRLTLSSGTRAKTGHDVRPESKHLLYFQENYPEKPARCPVFRIGVADSGCPTHLIAMVMFA